MARKIEIKSDKPKPKRKRKAVTPAKEKPGVGDMVEKVTKATGIKKAVDIFSLITGADCGCEERKEKLNAMFRRKRLKARCITKDEYYQLNLILDGLKRTIKPAQQRQIAKMYSAIFGTRYEIWCDACPQIWRDKIDDLKGVAEVYRKEIEKAAQ